MKRFLSTLVLIMMSIYAISQNGYPKKTVLDNDTVIAFLPSQIETINFVYDQRNYYCELSDSLYCELIRHESLAITVDSLIKSMQNEVYAHEEILMKTELRMITLAAHAEKTDNKLSRVTKQRNGLFWALVASVGINVLKLKN